jgi:membrane-associated phospholipid phosphatase
MAGLVSARNSFLLAALALAPAIALGLIAAGDTVVPGDVWVTRKVQAFDFPGVAQLERLGYHLGGTVGGLLQSFVVIAALAAARQYSAALLIALTLLARALNPAIKELFDSPRPTPDLVEVAANATADPQTYGYPSGHTMGAVLFYGGVIIIARQLLPPGRLRTALQALSLLLILIIAHSRIYSGAHWPSDVLGGALWGLGLLSLLVWVQPFIYERYAASNWSAETRSKGQAER